MVESELNPVVQEIAAERQRQIEAEGWTPEHDDEHHDGALAMAAALYATPRPLYEVNQWETGVSWFEAKWPFKRLGRDDIGPVIVPDGDKRRTTPRRRQLVKAAALIVAEIERLDRAGAKQ
jgi:hypothetical protein